MFDYFNSERVEVVFDLIRTGFWREDSECLGIEEGDERGMFEGESCIIAEFKINWFSNEEGEFLNLIIFGLFVPINSKEPPELEPS